MIKFYIDQSPWLAFFNYGSRRRQIIKLYLDLKYLLKIIFVDYINNVLREIN